MAVFERASVCTLDCPDTCSLTVTVNDGRIIKVRGSDALPYTDDVICNKAARHGAEFVHGKGRLPSMAFTARRIAWLSGSSRGSAGTRRSTRSMSVQIAVIERFGPQAVMPLNYAGPHGMLSTDSMSSAFLSASPRRQPALSPGLVRRRAHRSLGRHLCGAVPGISPEAAADAALNIVWGNNATVANLHLVRQTRRRRSEEAGTADGDRPAAHQDCRAGGSASGVAAWHRRAACVRPRRRTRTARRARSRFHRRARRRLRRVHMGIGAGMAWRRWPPGECGVALADIRRLAVCDGRGRSAGTGPWERGLSAGRNGGSGDLRGDRPASVAGKLGPRSGIVLGAGNAFPKTPAKLQRPDLVPPGTRTINILDVGRHLERDDLDPPLRAVFIYNHNPIVVHPDQNRLKTGVSREEIFLVGIEIAMTESMQYCDIVLPAASHFECDDLYASYGHHWLQRAEAVIPPVGEALPNTEIFRRLAARFSFTDACFGASDRELADDAVDDADPRLRGLRGSEIPADEALRMTAPDGRPLALFDNVMPDTPSGRIELTSDTLAERWGLRRRACRGSVRAWANFRSP